MSVEACRSDFWGVTMSIHKLTAGSGYDYLTRQVAALDATDKGHTGLASYYTEKGETPGVWVGAGLAGIDGLAAGDVVTAEQMQALFGSGHHPLALDRKQRLEGPGLTDADYQAATRLGTPYVVYENDVSAFGREVAVRIAAVNAADGLPGDWPVPTEVRATVRTQVAAEFFRTEYGRDPADARELAATIAKHSRPKTRAVAGYDLTFSPVKSVSALWALADPPTAARIERAHQAAVADALAFLETHALYTREGAAGVRQVDVTGLVATAFTHRDSRAGDPDLHTHVAVANKVATLDGRWLAIDGRVLFKATVAASETYNTALERHLRADLGVAFTERPGTDPRKRPVREIVGVDPALNARWSTRRVSIEARRAQLAAAFHTTHGRPPTPVESVQLAQQATLETRDAKHEPRTLTEQRATWRAQAGEVLGGDAGIAAMLHHATHPSGRRLNARPVDVDQVARTVIGELESRRATWQVWHVRAEAERQVRGIDTPPDRIPALVERVVARALHPDHSVSLARPETTVAEPALLRRRDGSSAYTVAGADLHTSPAVLAAEQRLLAAAGRHDGYVAAESAVALALLEATANGVTLNPGQASLVHDLATSGARLQLAIAPAGAGKTTAMRALAAAWAEDGGHVLGLAPSAAAADALRAQIDTATDTLAKLRHDLDRRTPASLTDARVWLSVPFEHRHDAYAAGARWDSDAECWYAPAGAVDTVDGGPLAPWRDWLTQIGPRTLVVIDEAGMADTLTLDAVTRYVIDRGGSVRLIGDDQQLAAIGAGGILRDIDATHGAARLVELVRFADPAEAGASLAMRDGHPEALGFYLDHQRVHVGDLATMTEAVFDAWQADRGHGLDAIMLAPTRDLAAQLNHRARAHRLAGTPDPDAVPAVRLADGNHASVGELVITRVNDRRLRTSATDWVKNGDRWTVLALGDDNSLHVQHVRTWRTVTLPAAYTRSAVELGYATTIHAAQGVSVDTMHGITVGQETRQQLYTMLTRGRHANHVYLDVAGDGDPHRLIRPEAIYPLTPTDLLEAVLARDDAPRSATTLLRDQADPAHLLGQAAPRYADAVHVAAEDHLGAHAVATLEAAAERTVPGVTAQRAWPTLRTHLILLAAHGTNPLPQLRAAADARPLDGADDTAAVLDWRLDDTGLRSASPGPLPWLPAIPPDLLAHPTWGPYLQQRADLVAGLAAQVGDAAATADIPAWAVQGSGHPSDQVLRDVAVWRAATGVEDTDLRPTGPPQRISAAGRWQRHLADQLTADQTPALQEWGPLLAHLAPRVARDPFAGTLAGRLSAMTRAGIDAAGILHRATASGPLPDDHPAAALWWRITRHLTPAVAHDATQAQRADTTWTSRLPDLLGTDRAARVQASPWWPHLVPAVDHAIARGWTLDALLSGLPDPDALAGDDEAQALTWRIAVLTEPVPDHDRDSRSDTPPDDLWDGVDLHPSRPLIEAAPPPTAQPARRADDGKDVAMNRPDLAHELAMAALRRDSLGPLEPPEDLITAALERAARFADSPVTPHRIAAINELTLTYYEQALPGSWSAQHLLDRLGVDLAGDARFRPGHAPAGWTHLVDHLRRHGITDEEMLAAGVVTTARTGRLIDRFRDRLVVPIIHRPDRWQDFETIPFAGDPVVLGFVARRHPDVTDPSIPKYINTGETALFHKGSQLYAAGTDLLVHGAKPVLVEGPLDAIAVTLATNNGRVGVAPLGTSLTQEQAQQLATLHTLAAVNWVDSEGMMPPAQPWLIVATDADPAGQIAAARAYWLLAQHDIDPEHAQFPDGLDPADLLTQRGHHALAESLTTSAPLADALIDKCLTDSPPAESLSKAAAVLAARPSATWAAGVERISTRTGRDPGGVRSALVDAARAWTDDPRPETRRQLDEVTRDRCPTAERATRPPQARWVALTTELDNRLPTEPDWPALAHLLDAAHADGQPVDAIAHRLVEAAPLGELPAQDLRYRLAAELGPETRLEEAPRQELPPPIGARAHQELPSSPTPPATSRPRR